MRYYCYSCKRSFSPVTNTPIINNWLHYLWPRLLELMFYGSQKRDSAKELGIYEISVSVKEKTLEIVMEEECRNIYQYSMQYKFALEDYVPPKVEQQIGLINSGFVLVLTLPIYYVLIAVFLVIESPFLIGKLPIGVLGMNCM